MTVPDGTTIRRLSSALSYRLPTVSPLALAEPCSVHGKMMWVTVWRSVSLACRASRSPDRPGDQPAVGQSKVEKAPFSVTLASCLHVPIIQLDHISRSARD